MATQRASYTRATVSIYYLVPDHDAPSGGIKQCYRHVEALHAAGYDARVLHLRPGFRLTWYRSTAPIAYFAEPWLRRIRRAVARRYRRLASLDGGYPYLAGVPLGTPVLHVDAAGATTLHRLGTEDVVVVPEFYGNLLAAPADHVPVVVFNQGPHLSFQDYPLDVSSRHSVYRDPIRGVLTVSLHGKRYLEYAFPGLSVWLTSNAVDTSIFCLGREKRRRIAFMPRKLRFDLIQVVSMLKFRDTLRDWELCPIEDKSEQETAALLQESAIFLSTLQQEGFGLPPLEAGLCGCIVVGYTGFAAREFMDPRFCYPVGERDVLEFASTIESILHRFAEDPKPLLAQAEQFSEYLRHAYSLERQATQIVDAWREILRVRAPSS